MADLSCFVMTCWTPIFFSFWKLRYLYCRHRELAWNRMTARQQEWPVWNIWRILTTRMSKLLSSARFAIRNSHWSSLVTGASITWLTVRKNPSPVHIALRLSFVAIKWESMFSQSTPMLQILNPWTQRSMSNRRINLSPKLKVTFKWVRVYIYLSIACCFGIVYKWELTA